MINVVGENKVRKIEMLGVSKVFSILHRLGWGYGWLR